MNGQNFDLTMEDVAKNPTITVTITNKDGSKAFMSFRLGVDEMERPQGTIIAKMKDGSEKERKISAQWTRWFSTPVTPPVPETQQTPEPLKEAA